MNRLLAIPALSAALLLGACASSSTASNPLILVMTRIANAGAADLTRVEAVASVPNTQMPGGIEDQDGLHCAQAGMIVLKQIQTVNAAANGPGAGVLTVAEMASLFQPGSPQYNAAANTLTSGCIAKANDILGPAGVIAAGGVVGAIAANSAILPLAMGG